MRIQPSNYSNYISLQVARERLITCYMCSMLHLLQPTRCPIQRSLIQEQLFTFSTIWLASTTCGRHQETTLLWQATPRSQSWPMEMLISVLEARLAREPSDYAM